ncbi:hypothetical protein GC174_09665 [bacterium]|nr:hypothetical protein [bacterium]
MDALVRNSFYSWLSGFPDLSRQRLKRINLAATSSAHIVLALSYGIFDPHIRALNRVITNFLLIRMKCERAGDNLRTARLETKLHELHEAIDFFTGVERIKDPEGRLCKRVVDLKRREAG